MSRLIAFGCSHTYGHGLDDCWNNLTKQPGKTPSKFAWPNRLAQVLDRECVNFGSPGASNKEILYNIQNFDFAKDDIVCILWSYITRYCILFTNKINQIVNEYKPNEFSEYDYLHQQWTCMNYANMFLEKKNVEQYHFTVHNDNIKNPPKWSEVNIQTLDFQFYAHTFPKALDLIHLGKKAHKNIAKDMKEIIDAHNK